MEPVSTRLKRLIDLKGIKYTAISESTGISVDAISKSFMNKRKLSADEMIAICNFAGIDLSDLKTTQI